MTWIGESDSYTVTAGERIAQLLICPIPEVNFTEVNQEELGTTERGLVVLGVLGNSKGAILYELTNLLSVDS